MHLTKWGKRSGDVHKCLVNIREVYAGLLLFVFMHIMVVTHTRR